MEAEALRDVIAELQAANAELEKKQRNAEGSLQEARDEAAQKVKQFQVGSTRQSSVHTWAIPSRHPHTCQCPEAVQLTTSLLSSPASVAMRSRTMSAR